MKAKLRGLLLVFALVLTVAAQDQGQGDTQVRKSVRKTSSVEGEDAPQGHNALRKLGRGIANVLFGFVEVPNQITHVTSDKGGAAGVTYGVGKGLVRWVAREFTGAYDVVTFPVPFPKGYRPVMKPEFPN